MSEQGTGRGDMETMWNVCQHKHLLVTIHGWNCIAALTVFDKSKITAFHRYCSYPEEHSRGTTMESFIEALEQISGNLSKHVIIYRCWITHHKAPFELAPQRREPPEYFPLFGQHDWTNCSYWTCRWNEHWENDRRHPMEPKPMTSFDQQTLKGQKTRWQLHTAEGDHEDRKHKYTWRRDLQGIICPVASAACASGSKGGGKYARSVALNKYDVTGSSPLKAGEGLTPLPDLTLWFTIGT